MKERKSILGRGLDELLDARADEGGVKEVSIGELQAGISQPRKRFDAEKIAQLSESIQETGLIQPIIVRKTNGIPPYEIIAGERRWLAAKQAGLTSIPIIVRRLDDREALKVAIVENIQREDLNVLEEAEAYKRLLNEHEYTQERIAQEVGKSRSHVANTLRLLSLPEEIKEFLATGQISPGHARALINSEDALATAKDIIEKKLNVRDTEERVKRKQAPMRAKEDDLIALSERISAHVKANVSVQAHHHGYQVTLRFAGPWELEDFITALQSAH